MHFPEDIRQNADAEKRVLQLEAHRPLDEVELGGHGDHL